MVITKLLTALKLIPILFLLISFSSLCAQSVGTGFKGKTSKFSGFNGRESSSSGGGAGVSCDAIVKETSFEGCSFDGFTDPGTHVQTSTAQANTGSCSIEMTAVLSRNSYYEFTANDGDSIYVEIYVYRTTANPKILEILGPPSFSTLTNVQASTTGSFQRLSRSWNATTTGSYRMNFRTTSGGGSAYWDDAKIEVWTPECQ